MKDELRLGQELLRNLMFDYVVYTRHLAPDEDAGPELEAWSKKYAVRAEEILKRELDKNPKLVKGWRLDPDRVIAYLLELVKEELYL